MPEKRVRERAQRDKAQGKAPSTQAGEFVREEMHHVREGKHGARNTKQAIAIGLSKARRSGVDLPPPKRGSTSESTRRHAERDTERGHNPKRSTSRRRSRATSRALAREGSRAASHESLSRQARGAAARRRRTDRSAAARKAAKTRKRESSQRG
jgi:hypothetical protein